MPTDYEVPDNTLVVRRAGRHASTSEDFRRLPVAVFHMLSSTVDACTNLMVSQDGKKLVIQLYKDEH